MGNAGAISGTVINAGFNGRVIEFSSSTRLDKDSTIIDGFTIKNGDVNGNEGSGIYASWNQGSGITINNSIISYNRKQCCSDGIAIALHGVDLYLNNVDISNNGSLLYWDERSTITLRYLKSVWNNVRFRSNEANNSLVYLYDTDLQIHNSDFIGNTVHDNNESVILVDWGSDLLLNHVTMTNLIGERKQTATLLGILGNKIGEKRNNSYNYCLNFPQGSQYSIVLKDCIKAFLSKILDQT